MKLENLHIAFAQDEEKSLQPDSSQPVCGFAYFNAAERVTLDDGIGLSGRNVGPDNSQPGCGLRLVLTI